MGPDLENVAVALSGTIPRKGHLFTTEETYLDLLKQRAAEEGAVVHEVSGDDISDSEMRGFSYIEHKDNVATALAVCQHLGADRTQALRGMHETNPDPGVVRRYRIRTHDKIIEFVSAFAANDPDSTLRIWELLRIHHEPDKTLIVLVNSRKDRIQRAEQIGEYIASHFDADFYVVTGEYTKPLVAKAIACGMPHNKIEDLGGRSLEAIFNSVVSLSGEKALVFGMGNIVGFGEEIIGFFKKRGEEIV
jgi:poly-gamma-glutamate synthase PgsB/CapB